MIPRVLGPLVLLVAFAGSASAGASAGASVGPFPCLDPSTAEADSGSIMITPAGNGPTLAARGLTVEVTVIDCVGTRVAGYPFQDIILSDVGNGDLNRCPGRTTADANTDALGRTTFSGALAGGGTTVAGLQVYLGGVPLLGPALAIRVNSPDLNGNRRVDVADVGLFAADFSSGVARFRSDLVEDGVLNVSDVGRFATHVREECP